jgi:hypothetical protein
LGGGKLFPEDEGPVKPGILVHDVADIEFSVDIFFRGMAHLHPKVRIVTKPGKGLGNVSGDRVDQESRFSVFDDIGDAPDAGGDDGELCLHRFEKDDGKSFPGRGDDKDVQGLENRRDIPAETEEADMIGEVKASDLVPERCVEFSLSHHEKLEVWPVMVLQDRGDGAQETGMILDRIQPADDPQDEIVFFEQQAVSGFFPGYGSFHAAEVDSVVDHDQSMGREAALSPEGGPDPEGYANDGVGDMGKSTVQEGLDFAEIEEDVVGGRDQQGFCADKGKAPPQVGRDEVGMNDIDPVSENMRPDFSENGEVEPGFSEEQVDRDAKIPHLPGEGTFFADQEDGKVEAFPVEVFQQIDQKLLCPVGWKSRKNVAHGNL